MTRFGVFYKIVSLIGVCAVAFISVVGAYPIHTTPCARYHKSIPSQLEASASAGPMFLKMLRNVMQKRNNLALSETQQKHIEEHLQQFQEAIAGIRQEFRDIRQAIRAQTYRRADVRDLETRRYMARLRLREAYMKHLAAILSVLTPEQRTKIRNRGLALLMLYTLGTEFQKLIPAPHTQKFTNLQPVYIDHTAEPSTFPEQSLFGLSVQEHLKIPLAPFPQHQDILRI